MLGDDRMARPSHLPSTWKDLGSLMGRLSSAGNCGHTSSLSVKLPAPVALSPGFFFSSLLGRLGSEISLLL